MSRLVRAVFALAWGLIAGISAPSARAEGAAAGLAPPLVWRFQAASPVTAAPAVAPSGNVYLASVEGVVHALGADGQLRWSYGVAGMPLGEPALDARERVYLATSATRLYSLHPDGRLRWRRPAQARVRSGAVWLEPGRVLYLGGERSLYALSGFGEAPDSVLARASGLFTGPGLVAALASGTGGPELWRWSGAGRARRLPLPQSVAAGGEVQLFAAGERLWLVAGGQLCALEPGDTRVVAWSAPARRAALSADGETLLLDTGTELRWLSARSGESSHRAPLPEAPSAPPALANDGLALVPLVSGELLIASPGHAELARVRVGSAPLLRPLWSESAGQVTAAAGDGSLRVLQLRGWRLLEPVRPPSDAGAAAVARTLEAGRQ